PGGPRSARCRGSGTASRRGGGSPRPGSGPGSSVGLPRCHATRDLPRRSGRRYAGAGARPPGYDRPTADGRPSRDRGAALSTRGIGDAYAFQRLLWLLVGTVIVPTVLLSLYGGMALRNQQAA